MAISSISSGGTSGLFEMYAEKIKAGKSGVPVGQTTESKDTDSDYTKMMKELQRQLRVVMQQIRRVQASNASAEQKAAQLGALNTQAASIQGQIQKLMAAQMKALQMQSGATAG